MNAASSPQSEDELLVVQTDPTGRFERYQKCLGMGAYKKVFLAFDQEEGVEVAWNELRLDHLQRKDVQKILTEVQILQQIRHDSIINLLSSWQVTDHQVYFITELMTSGTLKQYIKKTKIKPKIIKNWCRQILKGLIYLHNRPEPIIHRDLKCDNIFINGNNGQAKIGDLGLAVVKNCQYVSSVLGTPEFMAPELYDEKYDEKVDIYAFGMCLLEMVTKEYPYCECTNQAQIYRKVTQNIKPKSLEKVTDTELRAIIELCIEHDPNKRPSAIELMENEFFREKESDEGNKMKSFVESPLTTPALSSNGDPSPAFSPLDLTNQLKNLGVSSSSSGSYLTQQEQSFKENAQFILSIQLVSIQLPILTLKMRCLIPVAGSQGDSSHKSLQRQEVKFPFDLTKDTCLEVVKEMIGEGVLDKADEPVAIEWMQWVVANASSPRKPTHQRSSSNSSTSSFGLNTPSRQRSVSMAVPVPTSSPNLSPSESTVSVQSSPNNNNNSGLMRVRSISSPSGMSKRKKRSQSIGSANGISRLNTNQTSVSSLSLNRRLNSRSVTSLIRPIGNLVNSAYSQSPVILTPTSEGSENTPVSPYHKALEEKVNAIMEGAYQSSYRRGPVSSDLQPMMSLSLPPSPVLKLSTPSNRNVGSEWFLDQKEGLKEDLFTSQ